MKKIVKMNCPEAVNIEKFSFPCYSLQICIDQYWPMALVGIIAIRLPFTTEKGGNDAKAGVSDSIHSVHHDLFFIHCLWCQMALEKSQIH
jgi:hypothetical protein